METSGYVQLQCYPYHSSQICHYPLTSQYHSLMLLLCTRLTHLALVRQEQGFLQVFTQRQRSSHVISGKMWPGMSQT